MMKVEKERENIWTTILHDNTINNNANNFLAPENLLAVMRIKIKIKLLNIYMQPIYFYITTIIVMSLTLL